MNMTPTRTLVLVNLLALAGLAYLWVDPNGKLRNISWIAPAPVKPVIAVASIPVNSINSSDTSAFAAMLERPIFAPDRRPPPPILPPPPPPPPPPPDPLASVQLVGLFSGDVSGVLIRSEGKVRRVNLNQKLGEWTLQAIEDRSVTFARDNETRVIRLGYARLSAPVQPVQPVASQAPPMTGGAGATLEALNASRRAEDLEKERIRAEISARMTQKKP